MTLYVYAPSGEAGDFAKNHCLNACIGYQVVKDMVELKSLVESGQALYVGAETVDMLIPVLPVAGVEYLISREGIDTRNNPAVRTALVAGLAAGMYSGLSAVPQHVTPGEAERIVAEQQEAEADKTIPLGEETRAFADDGTRLAKAEADETLSGAESPSASPQGDLMAGAPVVVAPEAIPGNGQTEEPAAVSADPAAESLPATGDAEQPDIAGDSPAGDSASAQSEEERQAIIAAHYKEYGRGECAKLADALGISVPKARGALASYEKAQG